MSPHDSSDQPSVPSLPNEAMMRELLSRMGHLEQQIHRQHAGSSYNPHGKLRVYCPTHQVGFTVDRGVRQIVCQLRGEVIGEGLPFAGNWLFCCDCDRFIPFAGEALTKCPSCERELQSYYLCDRCNVLSVMGTERNDEREFTLQKNGPQPSCPGCQMHAPETTQLHSCTRLETTLRTGRAICPYCQKNTQATSEVNAPIASPQKAAPAKQEDSQGKVVIRRLNPPQNRNDIEAKAHFEKGKALSSEGRFREAIEEYSKVIVLSPRQSAAYCNRANAYKRLGDKERAIFDYNQAIELDPNFANAYFNRGLVYRELRQNLSAYADFEKAIALEPKYAEQYKKLGADLAPLSAGPPTPQSDAAPAKPINKDLEAKRCFEKGKSLNYEKRFTEAIEQYTKAIQYNPHLTEAYYNRGRTYQNLEQHKQAIADYNKAIELDPKYAKAYWHRGVAYSHHGLEEKANADYIKAIQLDPKFQEKYNQAQAQSEEKAEPLSTNLPSSNSDEMAQSSTTKISETNPFWSSDWPLLLGFVALVMVFVLIAALSNKEPEDPFVATSDELILSHDLNDDGVVEEFRKAAIYKNHVTIFIYQKKGNEEKVLGLFDVAPNEPRKSIEILDSKTNGFRNIGVIDHHRKTDLLKFEFNLYH